MQRVINFSGGETSGYMTILLYKPGDIVLFCDTGREHSGTYEFIKKFEFNEQIPVTKIHHEGYFTGMLKKRNYKRIPNRMMRTCTEELKVNTAKRYLKSIGIINFNNIIGFRYDEPERVKRYIEKFKKVITTFPLHDLKITKWNVNAFWEIKPYRLEIPKILGNCDLCFMKGKNAIIAILRVYPELADKWIEDETEAKKQFGHTYFPGITINELKTIAQNNLFKDYDLQEVQPAFNCSCTT